MNRIILFTLILSAVFASQYVQIPKKQIGLITGNKNAQIEIELIYDPICDNTAQFDNYFQSALNSLTSQERQNISVRFIPFALPFHMSSQKIVQGIIHVMQKKGHSAAIQLLRSFLRTKQQWYENKVRQESPAELMQRIAQKINHQFGLQVQGTVKQLTAGSKVQQKAKKWSKVVMGSLKIAGTPRFIINKASIDDAVNLKQYQITEILKSLFKTEENDQN